ncbi:hypothetical protein LEP1GSC039_1997 [Leptospira santarosai str. 2000027870]|nr:hypothetical protein LEP1GSC039_1997 [Leptospira santarosai str. 2000027870]
MIFLFNQHCQRDVDFLINFRKNNFQPISEPKKKSVFNHLALL